MRVVVERGRAAARGPVVGAAVVRDAALARRVAVLVVADQPHRALRAAEGRHAVERQRREMAVRHLRRDVAERHVGEAGGQGEHLDPPLVLHGHRLAVGAPVVAALVCERRPHREPVERDRAERAPAGRRQASRDERAPIHDTHPELPPVDRSRESRVKASYPTTASSCAYSRSTSRLAASWRRVERADRVGVGPARRVRELVLEPRELRLGALDLLLEPLLLPALVLRRRRPPAAAAASARGLGGFARFAVRSSWARSSRTRRYSAQPPT